MPNSIVKPNVHDGNRGLCQNPLNVHELALGMREREACTGVKQSYRAMCKVLACRKIRSRNEKQYHEF